MSKQWWLDSQEFQTTDNNSVCVFSEQLQLKNKKLF